MKLKTEQEVERLSVAHANMVNDASFPEWHGREASFRRGYTQAQQDLFSQASEEFEDYLFSMGAEAFAEESKDSVNLARYFWRACSISHAKKMQEKDAEIKRLKIKLNVCKNDYWFMINLIENYGSDKEQTLKDCLERMKFRKPMFEEVK